MRQVIVFSAALAFLGGFFLFGSAECRVEREEVRAMGISLSGILAPGEDAVLFRGYYACQSIERGDVVAYQYAPESTPFAKIVKGIPGDHISFFQESGAKYLAVNGARITTTRGEPYVLTESTVSLIAAYLDTRDMIPEGEYLLLGNLPAGTFDGTRFGLVAQSEIIGKIILE